MPDSRWKPTSTGPGAALEDSVDVANAQAEQLAARQQIISAEGMLTQYRETLRALIGADAQSMPAIHPVALPALQETLPPSLSFELLARRPDPQRCAATSPPP